MSEKKKQFRSGLTLIELMITILAVIVLVIGISGMLAAGHKNYNHMFARTNSEVVRNSYEARSIFDKIVRKSVYDYHNQSSSNNITVYYYSDPGNIATLDTDPDRYATFYLSGTNLMLQTGELADDWPPPNPPISGGFSIASNVTFAEFTIKGDSIRMSLTIDDKDDPKVKSTLRKVKMEVTTTAIRHNRLPN